MKTILAPLALAGLLYAATSADAAQSLIPTPYPGTVGSDAAVLDPGPMREGGPQHLVEDPYPQILGDTAQGNPPIMRHHRRQHLVGSINHRKYRVDRE